MKPLLLATLAAASAAISGCATYGPGGGFGDYDYNRPDPRYGYYDAGRYYHSGTDYVLTRNDRIYRGRNGRYYCRRSDGTTGLIVGGVAGGVLGNIIAPGGSELVGTLLGAGAGALLGQSIDKGQVHCR